MENRSPVQRFDERHIVVIADALRAGEPKGKAAQMAGFSAYAIRLHLTAGRADIEAGNNDTLDARFVVAYEEALIEHEADLARVVTRAAMDGDWHAAVAILERRFRDEWSRRAEVTGKNGGPVQTQLSLPLSMDDDDLEARIAELEDRKASSSVPGVS